MSNAVKDIEMLRSPAANEKLMVGKKLDLLWVYDIKEMAKNEWKISLYMFNNTSSEKYKLLMLNEAGRTSNSSEQYPSIFERLELELSYEKARFSIQNTTFQDTAIYWISFEHLKNATMSFQEAREVTIVGKAGSYK